MRIDLNCPVEAWKVQLHTPDNPACEVTLFNLCALQVVSVEVTLYLSSADGEETAKLIHRGRGLNGAPGRTFRMSVPVEGYVPADSYEITVDKVWFDNASVWRREKDGLTEYTPNNLRRSPQLTTLRSIAGDMASGYPEQQRGLWVCVCGRPNPDETVICARCHREKSDVFARYSREAVEAVVADREAELARHGRDTLRETGPRFADEKDFVRRKGRHGWIGRLAVALALIAAIGFAGYTWGVPYVRYELAMRAYEQGDYAAAAAQFARVPGYQQADYYADLSMYGQAMALLGDGDTLPLEADVIRAREILLSLGDADVSPPEADLSIPARQYWTFCDDYQAEIMFAEGR